MTPDVVKEQVLPALVQLSKDSIPNVRFNVAKALETLANTLKSQNNAALVEQIKPVLTKLKEDTDTDVRYFAQRALAAC